MSVPRILLILTCITLLPSSTADHACAGVAEVENQDLFEELNTVNVQLLQESFAISSGKERTKDLHSLPLPNLFTAAQDLPEQQILVELKLARHAHQQWENRVTALEAMLPLSRSIKHVEVPLSGEEAKIVRSRDPSSIMLWSWSWGDLVYMMGLILPASFAVLVAIGFVVEYERQHDKKLDPPWYHDSPTLQKVIALAAIIWLTMGMLFCTSILHFKEGRYLTIVESLYMSVEIVTTVGYGDNGPVSAWGRTFMIFYCILGVALCGAGLSLAISYELSKADGDTLGRGYDIMASLARLILVILVGTLLFACIPEEDKGLLEALYMSVITLLTIGFGDVTPVTVGGRLAGSLWMLIGIVCLSKEVAYFVSYVTRQRKSYRSKAFVFKYFDDICGSDQAIDRAEFLRFELVRQGVEEVTLQTANKQFDHFGRKLNGLLDSKEFRAYVQTYLS